MPSVGTAGRSNHRETTLIRKLTIVLLLVCAGSLVGCDSAAKGLLIRSDNYEVDLAYRPDPNPRTLAQWHVDEQFRIDVGPEDRPASLLCWVLHPTDEAKRSERLVDGKPRGTVLILHGYRNRMYNMLGWAEGFADAGYRAVMIDMRGHGRSSGDYISYGVNEHNDAIAVIDELVRRDLLAGRLGVWGISMGGSTAIMAAAKDPRIATVVAVAPFTSLRAVLPGFSRTAIIGAFDTDEEIQQFLDDASEEAGFDPDDADALSAMKRVKVPVMIVHGQADNWVPVDHGRQLFDAAPPGSHLFVQAAAGHLDVHFDIGGEIEVESIKWINHHLGPK